MILKNIKSVELLEDEQLRFVYGGIHMETDPLDSETKDSVSYDSNRTDIGNRNKKKKEKKEKKKGTWFSNATDTVMNDTFQ